MKMVILSVTLLFGVVGWVVAHLLTHRRSVIADRRKVAIDYRISAYRNLNHFACHCVSGVAATEGMVKEFNSAIADIQLFGCPSEIVLAQKLAKAIHYTGNNDPNTLRKLLLDLRLNLRKELQIADDSDVSFEPVFFFAQFGGAQQKNESEALPDLNKIKISSLESNSKS